MGLKDTLTNGYSKYLTPSFMKVISDHSTILRNGAIPTQIEPRHAIKFKNNFYGLLRELGVLPQYWYATLIINNYRSPYEVGSVDTIRIPKSSEIDKLLAVHNTTKRDLF